MERVRVRAAPRDWIRRRGCMHAEGKEDTTQPAWRGQRAGRLRRVLRRGDGRQLPPAAGRVNSFDVLALAVACISLVWAVTPQSAHPLNGRDPRFSPHHHGGLFMLDHCKCTRAAVTSVAAVPP
ncbi:hypothetical protein K458DRAFT_389396 [Lentithecium fluviatile CBS 122367]|uniref:Uncharacterized protein n=1 Tax=Lentithecium fluviatile CBS 122367 TaxID=1168545 RepID=A0A6G1J1B7_9PLEO|nr:hypothetical protein K458DRAFT_389396 [Lentithecium fluviatile CBS 122367]